MTSIAKMNGCAHGAANWRSATIHRVLKPLVSVQMTTIDADFFLSLPVFCYNNILRLQKRS